MWKKNDNQSFFSLLAMPLCSKEHPSNPRAIMIASRSLPSAWKLKVVIFDYENSWLPMSGSVPLDPRLMVIHAFVPAQSHMTSLCLVGVLYEALALLECILAEEVDLHHHSVFSTFLGILLQSIQPTIVDTPQGRFPSLFIYSLKNS